jgi:hypothetical protein
MPIHSSNNDDYELLSYPVNLSRVLRTVKSILPNYRFEDRSEILDVSYSDEMNHKILMDIAACLVENYYKNPALSWMADFDQEVEIAYKLSVRGLGETELAIKNMYNRILTNRPENFDCVLSDHWSILYDLYSPNSFFCYNEE